MVSNANYPKMKWTLIALCLISSFVQIFGQQGKNKYILTGSIRNVRSGKITLCNIGSEKRYYGNSSIDISANISNHRFDMQVLNSDKNTYAYYFRIESGAAIGETGMVLLVPGDQEIYIDTLDPYIAPIIKHSGVQQELKNDYEPFFKNLVAKVKALDSSYDQLTIDYGKAVPEEKIAHLDKKWEQIKEENDSLFLEYARQHRHSYVTFWKLIERFSNNGYRDSYQCIFDSLDNAIHTYRSSRLFKDDMYHAGQMAVNKQFPLMKLNKLNGGQFDFDIHTYKSKYVLIEFWFGNCTPCIRDFGYLKEIYKKYNKMGFEMVGISTDELKNLKALNNVISGKGFSWVNYLDIAGIESKRYSIHLFPTNFLVDSNGKIVKKNITPFELEEYFMELALKSSFFDITNEPK